MKIRVLDIPEDGMNLEASGVEEPWFRKIVEEAFREDYPKGNRADLDLHLIRTGQNVQISGSARIDLHPTCDRCMESFDKSIDLPLHINLSPSHATEYSKETEDDGLGTDDTAFSFYKGEEIDLSEMIREMFVLGIPIQDLCQESCKGLCPHCGHNLNLGMCTCVPTTVDPRFAVLKQLLKS